MPVALALCLLLQASPAEPPKPVADPWAPVRFMLGEWTGESEGEPGKGTVSRTYRFVLQDKFIREENVSTYPPQPKNEKGEVHEHWSFVSYDRARCALVLRQFHQEGFVNQYVLRPKDGQGPLVFESEALENVPPGWKARESYRIVSPDEFVETFEIAPDGQTFSVYSQARFRRRRPGGG
jgi:hypothetical protein